LTGTPQATAGIHQPGLGGSQADAGERLPGKVVAFSSVDALPSLADRFPNGPILFGSVSR